MARREAAPYRPATLSQPGENGLVQRTTIHLVRHGDVENPQHVYYGRLPGFPLSEQGRDQAAAAGRVLRERPIVAIFASPQLRAQETARIIQNVLPDPAPFHTEPLVDEVRSPFDGASQVDMDRRNWNFYDEAPAGFEQPADVLARVKRFVQRTRQDFAGCEVVTVSHADPIVFYWMWLMDIPLRPENRRLLDRHGLDDDYPAKASISTFRFETEDWNERPQYGYRRPYER